MDRIKTFWNYFLIVALFLSIVHGLIYLATRPTYENINTWTIEFDGPTLKINEAISKYTNGYIEGSIKNDTKSIINLQYLKFDFFNTDGKLVGTIYKELKYFNVGETQNFRIEHKFKHVENIKIDMVDEKPEEINGLEEFINGIATDMDMQYVLPIAGIIAIFYLL